jgi:hypothetical protein
MYGRRSCCQAWDDLSKAAPELSEDGLHYPGKAADLMTDTLLNVVCNQHVASNHLPLESTCCNRYPLPNWKQVLTLVLLAFFGPFAWLYRQRTLHLHVLKANES